MLPVLALVGRPNVGKSTLFNRLTRSRDALVSDFPGMTRDRQYGKAVLDGQNYIVVDTGGITDEKTGLDALTTEQSVQAIDEADQILFLVDARAGLTAQDEKIVRLLRRCTKPVLLVINKAEGMETALAAADFYKLGIGTPFPLSAAHGSGLNDLITTIIERTDTAVTAENAVTDNSIKLTIVGRPNVGKSTLINRLLGEDRVIVSDVPGTTRDSIFIPLQRGDRHYTLVDTAGIRRKGKVFEVTEKFSVVKTLQAIEATEVALLVLDAAETITEQDLRLLGFILENNKALVVAINKWDGKTPDLRERVKSEIDRRLAFIPFVRIHFISALHGTGVGNLFDSINEAHASAGKKMTTPELNKILGDAVLQHNPPLVHGRRIKLRYAHSGGNYPPCIVIHGNQVDKLPDSYKRYLANAFQSRLKLTGTPVKLEFKAGENPFKDKKNVLTKHQIMKKKRLIRHVKKGR